MLLAECGAPAALAHFVALPVTRRSLAATTAVANLAANRMSVRCCFVFVDDEISCNILCGCRCRCCCFLCSCFADMSYLRGAGQCIATIAAHCGAACAAAERFIGPRGANGMRACTGKHDRARFAIPFLYPIRPMRDKRVLTLFLFSVSVSVCVCL